jgi:hypothetical protein
MATRTNVSIFRGADETLPFSIAEDVNGWSIVLYISDQVDDPTPTLTIPATILTTGAASTFAVTLSAAQTALLAQSAYYWEVSRTDLGEKAVLGYGTLTVVPRVTLTDEVSGVVDPAILGAGAAGPTTYLRGDSTWAIPVAAEIGDFAEAVDDRVAALIVAGANITTTYDDAAGTLTLSATGGGGGGASNLDDLGDVVIAGPLSGQVVRHTGTGWANSALQPGDLPATINANKIGDGSVSNTEFQFLGTVTSDVQTQLNGKAASSHAHAATDLTGGTVATARLGSGTADNSTFLRGDQTWATVPGGGGATALDDLTDVVITTPAAGQVLRHTGSGFVNAAIAAGDLPSAIDAAKLGAGTVSNTELGYLDGVTSAVQTQLNAKAASSHTHTAAAVTDFSEAVDNRVASLIVAGAGVTKVYNDGANTLTLSAGAAALDDLTDVAISAPASGQVLRHDGTGFVNAGIAAGDLPTGIDAARIGAGAVSNAEFAHLDGVTSALQGQIDGKAASSHNQAETTITFTDVTTGNASTSAHGFAPKATAPAAGLVSVLGIANGETVRSDKALFDATNPAALGTAGPGTATVAARRDHVHALPALGDLTDVGTATPTDKHVLVGDGDSFESRQLATADLSDVSEVTGADGDMLARVSGEWTNQTPAQVRTLLDALQNNVSATDKILGRATAGAGDVEEIACTAAGRALLDDATAADQRTTLGAAAASHAHAGSDITSGTVAAARLGSGTPSSANYLRGDGAWSAVDGLPSQTGNNGLFLTTNGTAASWAAGGGGSNGAIPADLGLITDTATGPSDWGSVA